MVMAFEASVNIDTEWEFLLAELLLARGRTPLPPARVEPGVPPAC